MAKIKQGQNGNLSKIFPFHFMKEPAERMPDRHNSVVENLS